MLPPHRMKPRLLAATAAALLTPLGLWLLAYSWPQQHLYYRNYRFDKSEARTLAAYPRAMLAHGDQAWQNLAPAQAASFYRRAVSRDVLFIDAWLKLAQTEAARGQLGTAREILAFVATTAGHTSRWQSSIALLAHELEMENAFRRSINFLVDRGLHVNDTLTLLDLHCGDAETSLAVLDATNQLAYLDWLMRWGRVSDARMVWQRLSGRKLTDETVLLKYIDFLVLNKVIGEAQTIWQTHGGTIGMTNGGFDHPLSGQVFDWRTYPPPGPYWKIRHTTSEGRDNTPGLKVIFFGKANIDFYHVYQIVPLLPGRGYRLTYGWRALRLTTDQGPFIDLVGYDCDGFYARGPMLLGSAGWQTEGIEFTLPPDCSAVQLHLRRMPSNRFDNKIEGTLWLDDFLIEPLEIRTDGGSVSTHRAGDLR